MAIVTRQLTGPIETAEHEVVDIGLGAFAISDCRRRRSYSAV